MFLSEKLAEQGFAPVCWDMTTDMVISRLDGKKVQWERDSLPMHFCEGVACVRIDDLRNMPGSLRASVLPLTDVQAAARYIVGDGEIHHNG